MGCLPRHVLERQLIERHAASDDVRLSARHVIHRKRSREPVRLVRHLQRKRPERHSPDLIQLSPRAGPVHWHGTSDGLHRNVPDDHRRCDIDDESAGEPGDRRRKCRSGRTRGDRRSAHAAAAHTKGTSGRTTSAADGKNIRRACRQWCSARQTEQGQRRKVASRLRQRRARCCVSEPAADHALKNNSVPPVAMPRIREPSMDRVAAALPNDAGEVQHRRRRQQLTERVRCERPPKHGSAHRNGCNRHRPHARRVRTRNARARRQSMPNRAASMKRSGMAASSGSPRNSSECHASRYAAGRAVQISEGREIDIRRAERQQVLRIARVRDEIEGAIGWQREDCGAGWRTDQQVRKYIKKAEPDKPLSYLWIRHVAVRAWPAATGTSPLPNPRGRRRRPA